MEPIGSYAHFVLPDEADAADVRKVKGIKQFMRFLKALKSFALPVATALLLCIPAAFIAVDIYLASERDIAASKAAQTGQPELELIDPTIGTYDGGPELALLAAADPDDDIVQVLDLSVYRLLRTFAFSLQF